MNKNCKSNENLIPQILALSYRNLKRIRRFTFLNLLYSFNANSSKVRYDMQIFAIHVRSTITSMLLNDNIVINQSKQLLNILTRGEWATSLTRETQFKSMNTFARSYDYIYYKTGPVVQSPLGKQLALHQVKLESLHPNILYAKFP